MKKLSLSEAFDKAKRYEKVGNYEEAFAIYSALKRSIPQNQKAQNGFDRASKKLLKQRADIGKAIKLFDSADFLETEKFCKTALANDSGNVILLNILGLVLHRQRDYINSQRTFKKALQLKPDYTEAYYNLGNTYLDQRNFTDAVSCYKKALKFEPDYLDAYLNLALCLQSGGDVEGAVKAYRKALEINPNNAETHNNIGTLLEAKGQLQDAKAAFTAAVNLKPDYALALKNLGTTLSALEQYENALQVLGSAIELDPTWAQPRYAIGQVYKILGDFEKARDALQKVIAISPNFAEGHRSLGSVLRNLGDIAGAEECFKRALEIQPRFPKCLRQLCVTAKLQQDDPIIILMKDLSEEEDLSLDDTCHLNFALGYAYTSFEDYENASKCLIKANAARMEMLGYKIETDIELMGNLKKTSFKLNEIQLPKDTEPAMPIPIFILGMPRSGTTLLEQIISAHPEVSGAGELSYVNRLGGDIACGMDEPTLENVLEFRRNYLDAISAFADGRKYVSDKMPHNFRHVALIKCAFPEAIVVHSRRDAGAICWSNFYQFFPAKGLSYCFGLDTVVEYYKLYEDIMEFWNNQYPNYLINNDYEDLTLNQEEETKLLIKEMGLPWDDACLSPHKNSRAIKTASAAQVRKEVYKGSSQKWRKFEPYLGGAFDALYE